VILRPAWKRLRLLGLALPLTAALLPSAGTADDSAVVPHMMGSIATVAHNRSGPGPAGPSSPLLYQTANAPVQSGASLYLVFWGAQWQVGWDDVSTNSAGVYPSSKAQTYITDFVKYVSSTATAWNATTTQYCSGVQVNSTSCPSGHPTPTNPPTYGGVWLDTNSPPPPTVLNDNCVVLVCLVPGGTLDAANMLAAEALRAAAHFNNHTHNANYLIMLPKATVTLGADAVYCAYHSEVKDGIDSIAYTNMPFIIDQPVGCGANFVNNDSTYGNGIYDGYSIVLGHEIAEAETDPLPFTKAAWRDSSGQENGDKCAWITPGTAGGAHNIGPDANGHVFAVQTLYSNSAGGCAG